MKPPKLTSLIILPAIATALLLATASPVRAAATLWNGPSISFYHTDENRLADQLTPGVALTRGTSGGLYNSVTETSADSGVSPADTEWAIGDLSAYATLSYSACPLEQGNFPPGYADPPTTFVVHLINENIYLSLTLTNWGGEGGSGDHTFGYTRTTAAVVVPPTPSVTLTNPAGGAVFAAPANLKLSASASVSSGTVTNVQFFAGTTPLGAVGATPFNLTSGSLAAGTYLLTAVATAAGISATSTVVTVTVVTPATVNLSTPTVTTGKFVFNFSANTGLSYVVQSSTNLLNWVPVTTNVASGGSVTFTNPVSPTGHSFYRVGRLPNP
jgi:hypothetical protein